MPRVKDIVRKIFGQLTVLEYAGSQDTGKGYARGFWRCLCACGRQTEVRTDALKSGRATTCGSCSHDLIGQRFGRLMVVKQTGSTKQQKRLWYCKCDCGDYTSVAAGHLTSGLQMSCGCIRRSGDRRATHGHKRRGDTSKVYRSWINMRNRCFDPRTKNFKSYGGRGITVCETWSNSFEAFFVDVGPPARKELTLERLNPDGNYEPGNVVWATEMLQAMNKRKHATDFADFNAGLRELCVRAGISFDRAFAGLLIGGMAEAIRTP